jgi:1-aminocyclopropane-1-carboxylate deaminase
MPAANITSVGFFMLKFIAHEIKVNSMLSTNMQSPDLSAITIDKIPTSFHQADISLDILRLDKIHPLISGNKWFKLHFYLDKIRSEKKKRLVTFGGAWSNHIIATAAATKAEGIPSLGLIRGERGAVLSPILTEAMELGMELSFMDRKDYSNEILPDGIDPEYDLIVPQGGYGQEGMLGAMKILDHCEKKNYSHICCAVGTGTMMAGLINASAKDQQVLGFSAMKNNKDMEKAVRELLFDKEKEIRIDHEFHFGGYAKYDSAQIKFMNKFYLATEIPTDIVYTSKLFFAVLQRIKQGDFSNGSKILLIHSGGLTGNRSLKKGTLIF